MTAIIWSFFAAAMTAVLLRIIGRLPQLGGEFSWDDYTIFACAVCRKYVNNMGRVVNSYTGRSDPHLSFRAAHG